MSMPPPVGDQSTVRRGKNVYGAPIGILMVDTDLPRPVGDIGNARTFPFPVRYGIAHGARPDDMVAVKSGGVAAAFVTAAKEQQKQGASAIATSCGLLARDQQRLTEEVDIPVATSSLLLASLILRILPADEELAILTIDSRSLLDGGHFDGVGLTATEQRRIRVGGMEDGTHFHHAIMGGGQELDTSVATDEVLRVADRVRNESPSVGAFLLECTNLSPYAAALQVHTVLPVWDSASLVRWLHDGYRARLD